MNNILITGATGFLGSHLLEALLDLNYSVIILKRSTSKTWRIDHLLGKYVSYDIDKTSILDVFKNEKIDIVIHLATQYNKYENDNEICDMLKTNVIYPSEILEVGYRNDLKGFINTGTFFEYDCTIQPIDENAPLKPFNYYAKTKSIFESVLASYSDKLIISTLRLFTPYGEKDNLKLISMLIKKVILDEKIHLSEGLQKIDFVYVKDVINAYLKAIIRINDHPKSNDYQIFNIGYGKPLSVRDIVSIIEQVVGRTIAISWGEATHDMPIAYANIEKAIEYLNWKPTYSIFEGISRTIDYYSKE